MKEIEFKYPIRYFLIGRKNNPIGKTGKKDKLKYRIGSVMSVYVIVNLARGNKRDNLSPQGDQDYRIFITCR